MATITDSLFSLIIFIYVMVTFLYLFYGFCWIDTPKKTQAEIEEENKLVGFEDQDSPSLSGFSLTFAFAGGSSALGSRKNNSSVNIVLSPIVVK